jgi:hypothetical protein
MGQIECRGDACENPALFRESVQIEQKARFRMPTREDQNVGRYTSKSSFDRAERTFSTLREPQRGQRQEAKRQTRETINQPGSHSPAVKRLASACRECPCIEWRIVR